MTSIPPPPDDPYGISAGLPDPVGMRQPDRGVRYTSDLGPDPEFDRHRKTAMVYADVLPRLWAYLIDSFVIAIPVAIVYVLTFPDAKPTGEECGSQLLGQVFPCTAVDQDKANKVYAFCVLLAFVLSILLLVLPIGTNGKSPGMWVLGIKVVNPETNAPIGFGRAFARHLVSYLSFGLCGVGAIWAVFSDTKQTWHDIIAASVVVRGR
jgi:uncharacterized RDD family membrane protein YckC